MTQIAAVRLIGSALAMLAPAWLDQRNVDQAAGGAGLGGDEVLLALRERHGDAGVAYLEAVTTRFSEAATELAPSTGLDADTLGDAADLLERVRGSFANGVPLEIADCSRLMASAQPALDDEAVSDVSSAAARWISNSAGNGNTHTTPLICIVLATLLVSTTDQPIEGAASSTEEPDPAREPRAPRLPTLIDQIRDHALSEIEARFSIELEDYGLQADAFATHAAAARAGSSEKIDRAAQSSEHQIVQAAITDMANAKRLSILAGSCRAIRAWAACAAGEFQASAGHFKLAVRHMANETHAMRASFMTAAIDMNILGSFISKPEELLLAARERAAELGVLVKSAPIQPRLQAALAIGHAELAVGRGFDQHETCANVIAFAEKIAAEARLAGLESVAIAATSLRCRTLLALIVQFGATAHIAEAEQAIADLIADSVAMGVGTGETATAARLMTLLQAAKALTRAEQGALALTIAELEQIGNSAPPAPWAVIRTARDVSDTLDAAFLELRANSARASLDTAPETIKQRLSLNPTQADDFGSWLSPGQAALLQLDRARLMRTANTTDPDHAARAASLHADAIKTLTMIKHPEAVATRAPYPSAP